MSILIYIIGDYGSIPQILCHPRCITRYSGIFVVKKGVIAMSNENKIRILYVQPGKYPEECFVVNELPPFSGLSAGNTFGARGFESSNVVYESPNPKG